MTVRALAVFMSIWLGFALMGGFVDGQILTSADEASMEQAMQPEIASEPIGGIAGFFSGVVGFVLATLDFLQGWFNMLALNFSFFAGGGLETLVGWIVRAIIGIPMITMLVIAFFGR